MRADQAGYRALADFPSPGTDVDGSPFTLWQHFGLKTQEEHPTATLRFHRDCRTDKVKVMSDFRCRSAVQQQVRTPARGEVVPDQIRVTELIRDGLGGD